MKKPLTKSVLPVHFEDFSGTQFERLVFAYHLRTATWQSLDWSGQSGGDGGRDVWGEMLGKDGSSESVCIQCVNRKRITLSKIKADLKKISSWKPKPARYRVVCGSAVPGLGMLYKPDHRGGMGWVEQLPVGPPAARLNLRMLALLPQRTPF